MKDIAALKEKLVSEYLAVSGATAICIVRQPKGYGFVVGRSAVYMPGIASANWVDRSQAAKIARLARKNTGQHPDKATAERELQRAASSHGAILTPNMIVLSRAKFAASKLESYLDTMNKSGGLAEFNKEFKRRRVAAGLRGEGFMSFGTAMLRLRRSLIRMLIGKQQVRWTESLFDEVLGNGGTGPRKTR